MQFIFRILNHIFIVLHFVVRNTTHTTSSSKDIFMTDG